MAAEGGRDVGVLDAVWPCGWRRGTLSRWGLWPQGVTACRQLGYLGQSNVVAALRGVGRGSCR